MSSAARMARSGTQSWTNAPEFAFAVTRSELAHRNRPRRSERVVRSVTWASYKADSSPRLPIGRRAAVVDLQGFQFSGLLAWWFWLATHIFFLIGFRNRISVLLDWALAYWTYQRGARIVLGQERSPKSPP